MFKKLLILSAITFSLAITLFHLIFVVPTRPDLVPSSQGVDRTYVSNDLYTCYQDKASQPIDISHGLTVTVWNIYKQNRDNWQQELAKISQGSQVVLLQEASMNDELQHWLVEEEWAGDHVNAFKAFNKSAGVLNLSKQLPIEACAYTYEEPWLQLPKSALWSRYWLSNGEQLAVINIHAVNFTFGTQDYRQQLQPLAQALREHRGPMIFAGDFNSWSDARFSVMREELLAIGLKEVIFEPDNRTQFVTGLPLDHIFYRNLELDTAKAPITDASDHNPMQVSFKAK